LDCDLRYQEHRSRQSCWSSLPIWYKRCI